MLHRMFEAGAGLNLIKDVSFDHVRNLMRAFNSLADENKDISNEALAAEWAKNEIFLELPQQKLTARAAKKESMSIFVRSHERHIEAQARKPMPLRQLGRLLEKI